MVRDLEDKDEVSWPGGSAGSVGGVAQQKTGPRELTEGRGLNGARLGIVRASC